MNEYTRIRIPEEARQNFIKEALSPLSNKGFSDKEIKCLSGAFGSNDVPREFEVIKTDAYFTHDINCMSLNDTMRDMNIPDTEYIRNRYLGYWMSEDSKNSYPSINIFARSHIYEDEDRNMYVICPPTEDIKPKE